MFNGNILEIEKALYRICELNKIFFADLIHCISINEEDSFKINLDEIDDNYVFTVLYDYSFSEHYSLYMKLEIEVDINDFETNDFVVWATKYSLMAKHKIFSELDDILIVSIENRADKFISVSNINISNLKVYEDIYNEFEPTNIE